MAISPQTPDNSRSTAAKNELAFPVLSDIGLDAARAFGIAFTLPAPIAEAYLNGGTDLPKINGNGQWMLPLPATYLIGTDGRIAYAHVQADFRERAEPVDVLKRLRALQYTPPAERLDR